MLRIGLTLLKSARLHKFEKDVWEKFPHSIFSRNINLIALPLQQNGPGVKDGDLSGLEGLSFTMPYRARRALVEQVSRVT